ncbi:wound-induced protein 1 [Salvia miltiorrhiza]|uniref:wound-induced protein 1 n=1 Tax=Salvia miltiorrhiza TaxID=226208 RepID=UPI0025ABB672|nr:wound-induced protein 1 [Salvia miltiorrhiza]
MESKTINSAASSPQDSAIADVRRLYKAVASGGAGEIPGVMIAGDLEWWFHGPQKCHYMMKKLTGESSGRDFEFEPRNIDIVDDLVIVEGWEGAEVYWVHVWTLKDGVITQFREYFNTWLTVRDVRPLSCSGGGAAPLWQSHPQDLPERSLPGLMLAI